MYKGTITAATVVTANTDIPFATALNTNGKTAPVNGRVRILEPGYWNAKAQIDFTGYTGPVTFQFYHDGIAIPEAIWTINATAANTNTATLVDVFRVVHSASPALADLSVRASQDVTIPAAVFIIDEER